nr:NADH dehydrogenase subunit 2 [Borysthenes sp. 2 WQW-2023a]
MKMNSTKAMLMKIIFLSSMFSINTNNWFMTWMMIEINTIMFMPMMSSNKMNDQPIKYIIIQTISSFMILDSMMFKTMNMPTLIQITMLNSALSMKLAMSPFHAWMPMLISKMKWQKCIMMLSIMKISPMFMTSMITTMKHMMPTMMMSMLMGSTSGINQVSTKKILAYSSIFNSAWMLAAFFISKKLTLMFMTTYTLMMTHLIKTLENMNMIYLNQMNSTTKNQKINLLMSIFSNAGLPPMAGFLPKWMILSEMMNLSLLMAMMMIMSSTTSTYFYMKMVTPSILLSNSKKKKQNKNKMMSLMNLNILTLTIVFLMEAV